MTSPKHPDKPTTVEPPSSRATTTPAHVGNPEAAAAAIGARAGVDAPAPREPESLRDGGGGRGALPGQQAAPAMTWDDLDGARDAAASGDRGFLSVTTKHGKDFNRAGHTFSGAPTILDRSQLSEDAETRIRAEPMLVVSEVTHGEAGEILEAHGAETTGSDRRTAVELRAALRQSEERCHRLQSEIDWMKRERSEIGLGRVPASAVMDRGNLRSGRRQQ